MSASWASLAWASRPAAVLFSYYIRMHQSTTHFKSVGSELSIFIGKLDTSPLLNRDIQVSVSLPTKLGRRTQGESNETWLHFSPGMINLLESET